MPAGRGNSGGRGGRGGRGTGGRGRGNTVKPCHGWQMTQKVGAADVIDEDQFVVAAYNRARSYASAVVSQLDTQLTTKGLPSTRAGVLRLFLDDVESATCNVNGMRVVEHLTQKYAREIASCHETQPDLYATHRLHEDTKLPDP